MPDWSKAQAYAYTDALSAREWAWEFLRRNPEFRTACQRSSLVMALENEAATSLADYLALSAWGVIFRRSSRHSRPPSAHPVGPRSLLDRVPRTG